MKIKVPKEIKIGAYDFRVIHVPNLVEEYKLLGQLVTDKQIIKIEPNTTDQTKAVILWHEVIHAVSEVFGCGLEEENIDRIAQGIVSLLRDSFSIELDWSEIES